MKLNKRLRELSLEQGRIEDLLALKSDYEKQLRYFPKIVIEIGTTWGGEGQERAVYLSAYPNGIFLKQCSLGSKLQSSNSCSYVLAVHHNESLFFSVFNQYQYSAPHK